MVYRNSLFPARPTFKSNLESSNAGDYVQKKSASTTFCNPVCPTGRIIATNYNNLYNLRTSTLKRKNFYKATFNNNDLNINLFTKLNLKNVTVIDNNGIIDPSGVLFGNTECGMNNFENFIVPYYPCSSRNINSTYGNYNNWDNYNDDNGNNDNGNNDNGNNDNDNGLKSKITSNDLETNLFLSGNPTCDTPELNSSDDQIANTNFVQQNIISLRGDLNEDINSLREELIKEISSKETNTNNYPIIHINQDNTPSESYTVSKYTIYIVEIPTIFILLPNNSVTGESFYIHNKSGISIFIQSSNEDLIYNNFYINSVGENSFYLQNNFSSTFTYTTNEVTNISSYQVSIH